MKKETIYFTTNILSNFQAAKPNTNTKITSPLPLKNKGTEEQIHQPQLQLSKDDTTSNTGK
jgi:hypothetical protein